MDEQEILSTDAIETPNGRGARAHTVANIVLTVLATAAFFFLALFVYSAIDAYIGMKSFDGEGINGAGIGYALSFVFVLAMSALAIPLSAASVISSAIAVKIRTGGARRASLVMLIITASYILLNIVSVVLLYIMGTP